MWRRLRSIAALLLAFPLLGSVLDCDDGGSPAPTDLGSEGCSPGLDGFYALWFETESSDFNCVAHETRAEVQIQGGTIRFEPQIGTFSLTGTVASATWTESWTAGGVTTVGSFTITVDPSNCTVRGQGTFTKDFPGGTSCAGRADITGEKKRS